MARWVTLCSAVVLVSAVAAPPVQAAGRDRAIAVVMTNDPVSNEIRVYDTGTHTLLQTLSTQGRGGASGNARGVRQLDGELVAAVNYGSNTVALFRRDGRSLRFDRLVTTASGPVSVDFGNDHMYVAGATTIESFPLHQHAVSGSDGAAVLALAGGALPPDGSTGQVGVVDRQTLLVTLKADPEPGTVDVVALRDGAVSGTAPLAVSAPAGTLAPFGFAVYDDGTAAITLAHSNEDGLFRDGAFTSVVAAGQGAPCWMTRTGKYVFAANTGSRTISRLIGTGSHLFVDDAVAASIATGGAPSDLDGEDGVLGVIDHAAGQSHLSLFAYNEFGELTESGAPITVGVANANGVAIMAADHDVR